MGKYRIWIAVAGFFLIGLGKAAESPKGSRMPHSSPPEKGQTENKARGNEYPTENAPLPVRVVQSPSDAAHGAGREAKADEHEAKDLDAQVRQAGASEQQAAASWWAVVLTGLGSGFLLWTLFETRRTANAARQSADAFMVAERPNLIFESVKIFGLDELPDDDPDSGEPSTPHLGFKIKNHGRSPAWITQSSFDLIISDTLPDSPVWKEDEVSWLDIIVPNGKISRICGLPGDETYSGEFGRITQQQHEGLRAGRPKIFFLGRVKYRDQFDRIHVVSGAWEQMIFGFDYSEKIKWGMVPCGPRSYWEYT